MSSTTTTTTNWTNKRRYFARPTSTLPRTCCNCKHIHFSFECPPSLMRYSPPPPQSTPSGFRANARPIGGRMFGATTRTNGYFNASTSRGNHSGIHVQRDKNNNTGHIKDRNHQRGHRSHGESSHGNYRAAHSRPSSSQVARSSSHQMHHHPPPSAFPPAPAHPFARPPHFPPMSQARRSSRKTVQRNPGTRGGVRSAISMMNPCQPNETKMVQLTSELRPFAFGLDDMYEEQPLQSPPTQEPIMSPHHIYSFSTTQVFDENGNAVREFEEACEYTLGGPNDSIVMVHLEEDFTFC